MLTKEAHAQNMAEMSCLVKQALVSPSAILAGAGVGGVVGGGGLALADYMTGKDKKRIIQDSILGGLTGAVAGGSIGHLMNRGVGRAVGDVVDPNNQPISSEGTTKLTPNDIDKSRTEARWDNSVPGRFSRVATNKLINFGGGAALTPKNPKVGLGVGLLVDLFQGFTGKSWT